MVFPMEEQLGKRQSGRPGPAILPPWHRQLLCHQEGGLLRHTGQEEHDEQDTLHRLHWDTCQALLCLAKFHSRGLLASAHLGLTAEKGMHVFRGPPRLAEHSWKLLMDPCPENFVLVYKASQYPKMKFQWVWVEGERESSSLGFLSTEALAET